MTSLYVKVLQKNTWHLQDKYKKSQGIIVFLPVGIQAGIVLGELTNTSH